jgi:hypothetical protein
MAVPLRFSTFDKNAGNYGARPKKLFVLQQTQQGFLPRCKTACCREFVNEFVPAQRAMRKTT